MIKKKLLCSLLHRGFFFAKVYSMKLDPLFTVKENKLYKLDGTLIDKPFGEVCGLDCTVEKDSFCNIKIEQKVIEPESECYNEEFLAALRDYLKAMEEKNAFAVLSIVPGIDDSQKSKILSSGADCAEVEGYVACVKHTARRVKDCTSVAGVQLMDEFASDGDASKIALMIDELKVKHAQYVYFASKTVFEKAKTAGEEYSSVVVVVE